MNPRFGMRTAIAVACYALIGFGPAHAGPDMVMGGGLQQLVAAWENADPRLQAQLNLHLKSASGEPLVHVVLEPGTKPDQVLPSLREAGFRLTVVSALDSSHIEGYLPLNQARAASALPGVRSIHATQRPRHSAGSVQSQAVALQKADIAQAAGFDGTGVRIGVLSDSYDTCTTCTTHAAGDVSSGDLPAAGVTVLQDFAGGTDEGRAMLQLIHDVAPGSQLGFATADTGQLGFANNIIKLRRQFKADVIVDDVYYFAEPFFSDGVIAQAVDAVFKDGAAYYSSAGNNGVEAFEAFYNPISFERAKASLARGSGNIKLDTIPPALRPKSVHVFGGDREDDAPPRISQTYTTPTQNIIVFQWDEPFFLGKVKTDFNIYVFDAAGNWMDPDSPDFPGFYSLDDNTKTDRAFEFIVLPPFPGEVHGGANVSDYQIVIGNVNDGPARRIRYITENGLGVSQKQGAPSIVGHAAARGAQAVAAAYYAIPNFPEDFSSGGPATILFDTAGRRLDDPDVRRVPQITAADGVDTTFFGFDSDGNGFPNFFGTSAAAPNAAATAALVIQAAGGPGRVKPEAVYRVLQETATRLPTPNDRTHAEARTGPVLFSADGDWTRWSRYFGLTVDKGASGAVKSVSIDVTDPGLFFSANPGRFHIGVSSGATLADITRTRSANGKTFTLTFAPGKFPAGSELRFGMSVFNPIQGSTQVDPDRLRGAKVTATMEDGRVFSSTVTASPKLPINRFTGAGLVNAAAAVRRVQQRGDNDD